ncbi:MAG: hypothetical protein SRB2_03250 [Desulfobacteraceae bacterium Eth-SRB2]|nr:MAG: hypothetical protein SRB2_03250 [Desulfobacteraceae bacterium Eth-SRB2]
MNLDLRSILQNTEVGLLFQSPELAARVEYAFGLNLHLENSWQIKLNEKGKVFWESSAGVVKHQPARSLWQRIEDCLIPASLVEKQL